VQLLLYNLKTAILHILLFIFKIAEEPLLNWN